MPPKSKVTDMILKVDTITDKTVKLKLVTIIIGAVDVIIGSVGSCGYANDLFFLVTIIVCFCFSFLLLLCTFLDMFKINCTSKGMDFVYHILAAFIILLASIILLSATSPSTCGVMEKTSSATLAIINSCLYLYISWAILNRLKDKGETILPLYFLCICSRNPVVMPVKERPASTTTAVGLFSSDLPQSPQTSVHQPSQSQQQHSRYPTPTPTQIVQVKTKTPTPPPPVET